MSYVFMIPGPLRQFSGDRAEIRVSGAASSVSDALSLLFENAPGVRDRVITELGQVRPHINIFVDGENLRDLGGLRAPVRDGAEIFILPALSGG
jgi:sulfur-carrier protein